MPYDVYATNNGLRTTDIAKLPLTNNCLYDYIRQFGKAQANHFFNLEGVS
jgi:hypothetical protein